ncbi:hypothetical protein NOI24_21355 [Neorhizobium galegae]|uniref:hypothetical protein n=1 Tax=Neorhizobium galegae TaxID=399 RepID=UPI002106CA73|nr:hypothetical protein [Neorhizobium galegae]MCQ1773865.1 hypothetical protein [Neorhizobium galegae]MCQ1799668.1 hypothetical protein [Neorhizobium galegae]
MPDNVLGSISNLHRKAIAGDDLGPYLSRFSRTHGYTGSAENRRKGPSWADGGKGDKDFAVHAYETHHLHLVPMNENLKRKGHSDDLLFVNINRTQMRFLMMGSHRSFDSAELRTSVARARKADGLVIKGINPIGRSEENLGRMYRQGINSVASVEGEAVMMGVMSSGGTSFFYTRQADRIMIFLEEWEEKLDTVEGRKELSVKGRIPTHYLNNFTWGFWYGDFCLVNGEGQGICLIPWSR